MTCVSGNCIMIDMHAGDREVLLKMAQNCYNNSYDPEQVLFIHSFTESHNRKLQMMSIEKGFDGRSPNDTCFKV